MNGSTSRGKELTKNTLIISAGRASTQIITFLLLPLYTSILSAEEYGVVDFVTVLAQLIVPVISLLIDQGAFRLLLNCQTEDQKKEAISSAVGILLVSTTISFLIFLVISPFFEFNYKVWTILIIFFNAISNLVLQLARGLKKTGSYAIASFLLSGMTLVFNVILIAYFRIGAVGMLIAVAVGYFISSAFLFFNLGIWKYISINKIRKKVIVDELKYSIPLIPNQLSLWVMNGSDRVIVTFFLGAAANGIMAISHKFPSLFSFFYHVFQLAWHETGTVHYFDKDRDEFFTDMIKKCLSLFSTLCIWVITILPILFPILVNKSYGEAYNNVPIYMVASLLNIALGLLGVIYVATKKTGEIAKTTIIAALINIVVNIGLIKFIGLYAASISTFIGYLVTLLYRVHDTKRYINIKYDNKQLSAIFFGIIISCTIYYINNVLLSLILFPIFIIAGFAFNKSTIKSLVNIVKNRYSFITITRKLTIIFLIVCIVLYCFASIYIYHVLAEKATPIQKTKDATYEQIYPVRTIYFSEFGADDFTCTGITIDSKNNSICIVDCGIHKGSQRTNPKVVVLDPEFKGIINEIDLSQLYDDNDTVQGIAFDKTNDSFWLAAGNKIAEINRNGEIIKEITFEDLRSYKANGICYDDSDDSLWVLCYRKLLIHIDKSGNIINKMPFDYSDQDHLTKINDKLLITVGADYNGEDNYICQFSTKEARITNIYNTIETYALEGICANNDMIIVANDGLYHDALNNHSYLSIFNINDFAHNTDK